MFGFKDRKKSALTAKKVGEWRLATKKIGKLAQTEVEVAAIINAQAYRSAQRIKRNIRQQSYGWPELAEETLKRKMRLGQDLRMLIANGDYVNAIQVLPMGPNLWGIGIPASDNNRDGKSLAMIGLSHEYGLGGQPPRPHWRREYAVFTAQVTGAVNAWLKTKV